MIEALCGLLRCRPEQVADLGSGRYQVHGRPYWLVGPGTPAGLPAMSAITQIGERGGYKIYTVQ